jgi:hypothetical protein
VVISFERDVPFPETNWFAYRDLYIAEQQLRRVALAAAMVQGGSHVLGSLPAEVAVSSKTAIAQLKQRTYLGSDDAAEALWTTTLDQLRLVLTGEPALRRTVGQLTGFTSRLLESKLDEIREIRNIVGHNRAVSTKTLTILQAALTSLEQGFEQFRTIIFSSQYATFDFEMDGTPRVPMPLDHPLRPVLDRWVAETPLPFPPGALRLGESDWFYYLVLVPEEFRLQPVSDTEAYVGRWADLEVLLRRCEMSLHAVLAFTINVGGHTLSVVWSKACTEVEHEQVVADFVGCVGSIWGGIEYPAQAEQVVCHPKIWFHSAW